MFKALGNHRFSLTKHVREYGHDRPMWRIVFQNRAGRVFRAAPGEWDSKEIPTDPRYRSFRHARVNVGNVYFAWTQKRAGLGLLPVLAERRCKAVTR